MATLAQNSLHLFRTFNMFDLVRFGLLANGLDAVLPLLAVTRESERELGSRTDLRTVPIEDVNGNCYADGDAG